MAKLGEFCAWVVKYEDGSVGSCSCLCADDLCATEDSAAEVAESEGGKPVRVLVTVEEIV